ncbi:hypothetical protein L3Q82_005371 [Scortum barcoo]|uniref:Uncharacterized protein n=1 Tax=Scortum barcoo TaxID=214431 RepID=A0ACB8VA72_9TELE|nr:hypothetical protein L3Q82_005371 [Scortum barcoo]
MGLIKKVSPLDTGMTQSEGDEPDPCFKPFISGGFVSLTGDAKITAIATFPVPTTRRELRRFLGMVGYYRRYCKNFSSVAAPLTALTSSLKPFTWNDECQQAFECLKGLLSCNPVLSAPDFSVPFKLEVGASAVGAGAVLLQEDTQGIDHPVSFGVQGPLLRTFYDSVVASAIFYGIVCWACSITDRDRKENGQTESETPELSEVPLVERWRFTEGTTGVQDGHSSLRSRLVSRMCQFWFKASGAATQNYPLASTFVEKNFYVDDGLVSVPSADEAKKQIAECQELCKRGGLRLHKFSSNEEGALTCLDPFKRAANIEPPGFDPTPSERALGIQWSIKDDTFSFNMSLKDQPSTRRGCLSVIASLYDPLGFIAPFSLSGKRILQELCHRGIRWDDPLPEEMKPWWEEWINGLLKSKEDVKGKPGGSRTLARSSVLSLCAESPLSAPPNPRPWFSTGKGWRALSRVGGEVLPQVEEFKYLGVLFTSEGKMERKIDRRIGAASTVMRSVYWTVVVKKELSRKAKLSIYRPSGTKVLANQSELQLQKLDDTTLIDNQYLHAC